VKPVPRSRHLLAGMILATTAAASCSLLAIDNTLSEEQIHLACSAMKGANPELFPNDIIYGRSKLWRFHPPVMLRLLTKLTSWCGPGSPHRPFQILGGVLIPLYLGGMYFLLYRQCRSSSIACFVSILSMVIVSFPGSAHWGIGPLASATPTGIAVAFSPWLLLFFLHYRDSRKLAVLFLCIGLLGNVHPVMALGLAAMLIAAHLARQGGTARAWAGAVAYLMCVVLPMLPYANVYVHLRGSIISSAELADLSGDYRPLLYDTLRSMDLLYPGLVKVMLNWDFFSRIAVLGCAAAAVLAGVERYRLADKAAWGALIVSCLVFSFGAHGLSQFAISNWGRGTTFTSFAGAACLVMLPLYALFGQGLTNLFRLLGQHRNALRWGCAVLLVAWVLPSDNLRIVRHASYNVLNTLVGGVRKSAEFSTAVKHQARKARTEELVAIGQWARRYTAPSAVFLSDRVELRAYACRSILASPYDAEYFCFHAPWRLAYWKQLLAGQRRYLRPATGRVDAREVRRFVAGLARQSEWTEVSEWLAVLPASTSPPDGTAAREISSENWGKYYRLFRIR